MHHADHLGLAEVVAKLKAYGPQMGPDFTISPLLERMAAEGKKFTS
jgi:3-hydroxyacyl-CoA dehydrogenase